MKKRRLFSIMAASVLAVGLLAGCGGKRRRDGQTDRRGAGTVRAVLREKGSQSMAGESVQR